MADTTKEPENTYNSTPIDAGTHPEDQSTLVLETIPDGKTQYLSYHLGTKAFQRGKAAGVEFHESEWPLLIAEYDLSKRVLTTYPTWLRSNQNNFTKAKYRTIKRISFENQDPMEVQEGFGLFFDLPTGFRRTPFEGFGVDPRIRYIIDAFDDVSGIVGLTICDDSDISIDGEEVRLPESIYHEVRLNINRAHEAAVAFANGEKQSYLKNRLLPSVVPGFVGEEYERPAVDLQDTVRTALVKKGTPRSRNSNTSAAVRTVMRSVAELAQDNPVELFQLSERIEVVSLEMLIESMTKEMAKRHKEGFWQAYFLENPFVLKILFGLPVVMYTSQASVGGMGMERTGEKYADYLLEAGMFGNLAIVEIKTTETPLLTKQAYRLPSLYGPSVDLAGGVNQLLDQRLKLIKSIAQKKEDDGNYHVQAWSTPCILIIGVNPTEPDLQRSFEIYRGSQRDVLVITFDELLIKLKALHEFLITKPDDAQSP
ncbi:MULTISPECIES: Shedu anti-phage system protein SduA domain-containing protein [Rhizobium]|uniref:DUF4263 domain-containing protein n=1 Tax=Rhizobium indicum TaxID=2583231 RepID=A0ABX6PR18_9HYPH|nr:MULTISPECIES: Shedu anti-phage system protein SduA domain-containing protein [Rhizobium]NEI63865.1 DUF4263 domain-containing protein [Rhizobium leguminosarum]NKL19303.1 DUF4263 domain-containing protein [Rhizobium leguminosarum bv. viciae]NKL38227.1 DUF4263 domain-containing protein [Rhizobium leguminosarum bv. viciae]NKL57731.1 DUF4263 domain-containing protein [Rhizobium leguminosarum bv. viciae]QKK21049.1 DUF4263 domain-containing protein [Rhizobium indicum]